MLSSAAPDAMLDRLQTQLAEKTAFCNEITQRAFQGDRDLTDQEQGLIKESQERMSALKAQIDVIGDVSKVSYEAAHRARQVGAEISRYTGQGREGFGPDGQVKYESPGAFILDMRASALGNREATERIETFHRAYNAEAGFYTGYRAADHARTTDELGVIPDPIVGEVINFIDAARPVVSFLGPRPMPSATWHRPVVSQHTAVSAQGSAGAAADEKAELVSQKLTITRLNANAVTYGGYVNVSRQVIDFSTPAGLDIIVNDLAAQFAISTEAAVDTAIAAVGTTAIGYGTPGNVTDAKVSQAIWKAAGQAYTAVRGQGRLFIAVAPDVLPVFGPLFAPYGPFNQQGQGFQAANFAQGVMGQISGIPVVMSAGFASGKAFLLSTAAIEAYEQRVGTLQVTEPSVMGVQVAYAGYFTPLTILAAGIIPLTST